MISFVCWKWADPRVGRTFDSSHVNVLARSIRRHYARPHRVVCVTDEPHGLAPEIIHVPMPRTGFEHLINPSERAPRPIVHGARWRPARPKPFPSCYRRLWNFSREAQHQLGERIFCLDIDAIIVNDLAPLVDRPGSFVGWHDPRFGWNKFAGGVYMMTTGAHQEVWTDFDPESSPAVAAAAGNSGSDQAWMSYKLFARVPPSQHWSPRDGLLKIKWLGRSHPPPHARIIFTNGHSPPWHYETQRQYPWIKDHWQ